MAINEQASRDKAPSTIAPPPPPRLTAAALMPQPPPPPRLAAAALMPQPPPPPLTAFRLAVSEGRKPSGYRPRFRLILTTARALFSSLALSTKPTPSYTIGFPARTIARRVPPSAVTNDKC